MTQPTTLDRRTFLQLAGATVVVGCTRPMPPDAGADASVADAPGADVPGTDVPGADVPGLDAPAAADAPSDAPVTLGAYDAAAQDARFDALYAAAFAALGHPRIKYVSLRGDDANGGDSLDDAYATLGRALGTVGSDGLVLVDDGEYAADESGWLNERTGTAVPSGSATGWTVIRAITPGRVRVVQSTQSYYGSILRAEAARRVWIDGIDFAHDARHDDEPIFLLGDAWRVTRCMFRRRQSGTYGATLYLGTGSLLQDCALYGAGRYLCNTGSNSGNAVAGSNVFRRVVCRLDWALGTQPVATFAHYGSDDAGWVDSKETLFANCIDIDGPAIENQASYGFKWGSFYHPKHQRDIRHRGCIVLNAGADLASFRSDNIGEPTLSAHDCVVWDNDNETQPGMSPAAFAAARGRFTLSRCTAGRVLGAPTDGTSDGAATHRFSDAGPDVLRPVGGVGAEILWCHGAFLSHWGEGGFDEPSPLPLWPYPYEGRIKAWMDEPIPRPSGHYPASPASSRQSFAGTSLGGAEQTLTRRIWECAGTATPSLATGAGVY